MPRPRKLRHVCSMPNYRKFAPLDAEEKKGVVTLTIDEYETIRLIDLEECTQEECAEQMNVARTTVQGIYNEARRKIADVLVNGSTLEIEGGEYKICGGTMCGRRLRKGCCREECMRDITIKETREMKIAIPAEEQNTGANVCMSYGRAPYFAIYDIENGEYSFIENTAAESSGGAGILASQILLDNGVSVVITPRLGQNAADVLTAANVTLKKSVEGSIEANVKAYHDGALSELVDIHPGFHGHHNA